MSMGTRVWHVSCTNRKVGEHIADDTLEKTQPGEMAFLDRVI
ncbi:hypothetical protein KSD_48230 [Ktedonobacter sp. SOSP1-85]|nr:hypothetical protein KSC_039410 [Ktedonobacter sp. SOSP1-52]GHO77052.1 hypothetical protein KSD_48230 [Ktedonobacter sp. SOSP1-85]